jgi:hypothetical protein
MHLTRRADSSATAKTLSCDFLPLQSPIAVQAETNELAHRTVRDLHELETLRVLWNSWPGTRDSDIDFFSGVIRSHGPGCRPHVIVLTRNSIPNAILVGLCEPRKMRFRMGAFSIWEPEVTVLEFVAGALRGNASAENCATFVRHAMRALDRGEADMALWKQLDVQSHLHKFAVELPHFALRDHVSPITHHWSLTNSSRGLNAFLLSRSSTQRSKLRRKYQNVISRFGEKAQVRCFRSLTELDAAIAHMEEIASKTVKRRMFGAGFYDNPNNREAMILAAARGWLRIYILYFEDKPAAFWRGTVYGRTLHADDVGYDPAWSKLSPGIFLFLRILEGLHEDDIQTVDFGVGNKQVQHILSDFHCVESRVHIYAATPRGLLLNVLHTAMPRADFLLQSFRCSVKLLLQRAGCLDWARKTSRNLCTR